MDNERIIYIPTKEEKLDIQKTCNQIIDILGKYPELEKKAFVLQMLITTFEECSNVKVTAILGNGDLG